MEIEETLKARGSQYGAFKLHAAITQDLKGVMESHIGWTNLTTDKKEALHMIVHKIGRIINGNPELHDSWHDIVGYAKLVADDLVSKKSSL